MGRVVEVIGCVGCVEVMGCLAVTWVVRHGGYRLWVTWVVSFVVWVVARLWGGLMMVARWWCGHVRFDVGYG